MSIRLLSQLFFKELSGGKCPVIIVIAHYAYHQRHILPEHQSESVFVSSVSVFTCNVADIARKHNKIALQLFQSFKRLYEITLISIYFAVGKRRQLRIGYYSRPEFALYSKLFFLHFDLHITPPPLPSRGIRYCVCNPNRKVFSFSSRPYNRKTP